MATAANRAALQTALLSVTIRSLRRRRLGHVGPDRYPRNGTCLDKWGRKTMIGGAGGASSNLLAGGAKRPPPRASLVLGGAANGSAISRRRNGLTAAAAVAPPHANGSVGSDVNGNGKVNNGGNSGSMVANKMMEQQRNAMSSRRYVNNGSSSSRTNGSLNSVYLHGDFNGSSSSSSTQASMTKEEDEKKKKPSNNKGKYSSDLVVVLDMDECLIHSQFLSDQLVDKYRQDEERPSFSSSSSHNEEAIMWSTCDSFRINLPDGDLVNVNKRPNLDLFLREITAKFETYIFTAAMEVYAAPVLDRLDPHGDMFCGRFYREHCVYDPDTGAYSKDLRDVMRVRRDERLKIAVNDENDASLANNATANTVADNDDERRVVLVDNNPLSFLANPSNGILVSSFYDDPKDDTLEAVMELLHELDGSGDVRPVLESKFGLREALDDIVRGASSSSGW